jgi:hypothetical protein
MNATLPLTQQAIDLAHANAETALKALDQRDEAVSLLKRALLMREMGAHGEWKSDARAFLERIGEKT